MCVLSCIKLDISIQNTTLHILFFFSIQCITQRFSSQSQSSILFSQQDKKGFESNLQSCKKIYSLIRSKGIIFSYSIWKVIVTYKDEKGIFYITKYKIDSTIKFMTKKKRKTSPVKLLFLFLMCFRWINFEHFISLDRILKKYSFKRIIMFPQIILCLKRKRKMKENKVLKLKAC